MADVPAPRTPDRPEHVEQEIASGVADNPATVYNAADEAAEDVWYYVDGEWYNWFGEKWEQKKTKTKTKKRSYAKVATAASTSQGDSKHSP